MAINLEAINEWKRFFESTGKDVFDLLASAIDVAARYHPDEFFERRDRIAQLLFARQQQPCGVNIHDDDVSEEEDTTTNSSDFSDMALRMKEHRVEGCVFGSKKSTCESKPRDSEIVISDSEKCPASAIGMGTENKEPKRRRTIRIKLRPKPNKEEQFPALDKAESQVAMEGSQKNATHIEGQKRQAPEKEKESETKHDAEVKLPVPHRVPKKSGTKAAKVGIVTGKFSEKSSERKITAEVGIATGKFPEKSNERKITEKTRVMIKEKKSMCWDFEVKLEASKRKLHEGYKHSEDAKQKKKIRMIEFKDLPRGGVGCRPANHFQSNKGKPMNRICSSWTR